MSRRWWLVDLVAILVFVGIGRSAHHHIVDLRGMVSTTWPFAAGLAIGWVIVILRHQRGVTLGAGVEVWLASVALGMTFRVLAGQGTAVAFILVSLGFLGLFMLGSRMAYRVLGTRRR